MLQVRLCQAGLAVPQLATRVHTVAHYAPLLLPRPVPLLLLPCPVPSRVSTRS